MKYLVAVETMQFVETEAENAEAAIESVKSQLDPRVAAAAAFQIVQELTYDEESGSYKVL
jgi:hypothetical protein